MSRRLDTTVKRSGFTLVEMLVVVAIVGLLAAVAVPAVMRAMRNAQESTIKIEVNMLAQALEDYRTKYGEYPPDGSDWNEFQRHCRRAFPGIVQSELSVLAPANATRVMGNTVDIANDSLTASGGPVRVMEPAEALVFFLGGFSNDPQHPFSGSGGPFAPIPGSNTADVQYNTNRGNAFFDFDAGRLTTKVVSVRYGSVDIDVTVSTDEEAFHSTTGIVNDLLPTYLQKYGKAPIAYFNSRTYVYPNPAAAPGGPDDPLVTRYESDVFGTAVPFVSEEQNTASALFEFRDPTGTATTKPRFFVNKASFQLVAAGMDGKFSNAVRLARSKRQIQIFPVRVGEIGNETLRSSDALFDNIVNFTDSTNIGTAARAADTAK